jgi:DnaA-homolog protein
MTQLVLPVRLSDYARLDNFFAQASSIQIVQAVRDCADCVSESWIYLAGNAGSGRSHLLQAACHASAENGEHDARYLPLQLLRDAAPDDVLADIETATLVCFDDVDVIAGNAEWELALFDALNRLRDSKCNVLFAAAQPPAALPIGLPDLQSRMTWATVYRLPDLDDAQKSTLLVFRAQWRGMTMSTEVAEFIVQRGSRDCAALMEILETLDQQSLAQSRRITIPFVKLVMGW